MDGYEQRHLLGGRRPLEPQSEFEARVRGERLTGTVERLEAKIDKLTIELKQISEKVNKCKS